MQIVEHFCEKDVIYEDFEWKSKLVCWEREGLEGKGFYVCMSLYDRSCDQRGISPLRPSVKVPFCPLCGKKYEPAI